MKKIKILWLLSLIFTLSNLKAQQATGQRANNSISINLAGTDLIGMSVQYERNYFYKDNLFFSGKLGLGVSQPICILGNSCKSNIIIPYHFTANWGKKRSFWENGIAGNINPQNFKRSFISPYTGYRFYPLQKNNLFFKIYVLVSIGPDLELNYVIPGITVGYAY